MNISYVIAFRGFQTHGQSEQIKEIAILNLRCGNAALYRFLLTTPYSSLSNEDKISVRKETKEVHGIIYENSGQELPPRYIPHILSRFIEDSNKSNSTIAYLGNTTGLHLLEQSGAQQTINFETLCCPSFHTLFLKEPYHAIAQKFRLHLCEHTRVFCHHRRLQTGAPAPCALTEVLYSGAWLLHTHSPLDNNTEHANHL